MKIVKKIFILLTVFFLSTTKAYGEKPSILIINQIRGEETCCQPGNTNFIEKIKKEENANHLPIGWTIRYDALIKNEYINLLKDNDSIGLLLEITPALAEKSGVFYKGKSDGSDWYFGKNAFLTGYTIDERKKLIDTLFSEFKSAFGSYPKFTASWIIDGWSLSYIHKKYNIILHELTKEQYETDSYTLYGGIFNFPYFPSKNHPLVPGRGNKKLNLIIVRQTISDLLKNYGYPKAIYTSQPNDYLKSKEGLDIAYFQSLLQDSLDQTSAFAMLGLENSSDFGKYTDEYIKQLKLVSNLAKNGEIKVEKPFDFAENFIKSHKENPSFYLQKNFYPSEKLGILWYFGKNYRAKVLLKDETLILDDLRIYNNLQDPYYKNPSMVNSSYWIIPFLFDGSSQYTLSSRQKEILRQKKLLGSLTLPDYLTSPFGVILGKKPFSVIENNSSLEISFISNQKGSVKFLPDTIVINKNINPHFAKPYSNISISGLFKYQKKAVFQFENFFELIVEPEDNKLIIGWERGSKFLPLFTIYENKSQFILSPIQQFDQHQFAFFNPIFQPDRSDLVIDSKKSIFYWHNRKAIAGRNPIRLFILPRNTLGRTTRVKKVTVAFSSKNYIKAILPEDYSYRISPWYIDIYAKKATKTDISISADGVKMVDRLHLEFVSDCKKNIKVCLFQPIKLFKYLSLIFKG